MAALLMTVAAAGCDPESGADGELGEGDVVRVAAEVARQISTRAYSEEGEVTEGTYYLTYPISNGNKLAEVRFGVEGSSPDIGMVIVPPDGPGSPDSHDGTELKWIDVGGGNTPTLYLDNVEPKYAAEGSTLTEIVFNEDNPFVAGFFDLNAARPANDLLWGSKQASRNAKMVNFELHHYMARVRVQVTVDRTNEQEDGDLDLEGATVTISSLVHKPYSYNRLDGTMKLSASPDEDPEYATLTLVGTVDDETYKWNKVEKNEDGLKDVYTTCDFVLPPQGLREDENRPVLTIQLADKKDGTKGKVYSGILPHAMVIHESEDPLDAGYPVALSFLKEYILTIRTVVTEEPPELSFMPVQVVQWVDKGKFTIEAHQSGVYTAKEFYDLVKYYKANNTYQLVRYGKFYEDEDGDKSKWVFDFWHSVTLDYGEIEGCMKDRSNGQKNFEFRFNGFTIYLSKDGKTESISEETLYKIVNE